MIGMNPEQESASGPRAVVLTTDLIFASRITGTGAASGIPTAAIVSPQRLDELLAVGGVRLVIVDMNASGDSGCEALRLAAGHSSMPATVAYFSHVQTELAEAARRAGASRVLPRSQFSAELPRILQEHCGPGA